MAPQSDEDQTVLGYRLRISPRGPVTTFRDGFGNRVDLFNLQAPYRELLLQATSYVRTHRRLGVAGLAGVPWLGRGPMPPEAMEYLLPSPQVLHTPEVDAFVRTLPEPSGTLADVNRRVTAEAERRKIAQALREAGNNKPRAADLLQVSYKTLLMKLKDYGIE